MESHSEVSHLTLLRKEKLSCPRNVIIAAGCMFKTEGGQLSEELFHHQIRFRLDRINMVFTFRTRSSGGQVKV